MPEIVVIDTGRMIGNRRVITEYVKPTTPIDIGKELLLLIMEKVKMKRGEDINA